MDPKQEAPPEGRLAMSQDVNSLPRDVHHNVSLDDGVQQKSSCESLPTELFGVIFGLLRKDSQRHIASCRLVSTTFHFHSTPFFVTELVISHQLPEISRAQRILDHSIFPKHITTLVFDASILQLEFKSISSLSDPYGDNLALASIHRPSMCDANVAKRQAEEYRMMDVLGVRKPQHVDPPLRELSRYLMRPHSPFNLGDDQVCAVSWMVEYPDQRLHTADSWSAYGVYSQQHQQIKNSGIVMAVIQRVFASMPKLDRLIFTDWRGLGRDGDKYDGLRTRLLSQCTTAGHS
ncbi:hypothetical protein LTR95_000590 [Oleoguttula sp. CCFEE 5521]